MARNGTGLVFAGRALHAGLVCGRWAAGRRHHGNIAMVHCPIAARRRLRTPNSVLNMELAHRATLSSQPQLCQASLTVPRRISS
ncbi:hypothetical protein PHLGIDRAFT_382392 [Phlebiopsis gigantea 11061_1 CR5-6]|uniref:Uncharacterized protein n=1 Tax=Phlebiopsis gigantea (strain 11061_1 CR5-6) TaxID=745531 RepID=A0A0C3SBW6_PHLG1|nr:hypothetical protein PHLGIDRAFT_382392 [Phlebiopsis gigantea 11061_1 CR5-6]